MNPMAWNIAAVLLPPFVLAFLSHQAGERIRCFKFLPGRALGLSLMEGWLGCSLLTFLALINVVIPLTAWAWTTVVK